MSIQSEINRIAGAKSDIADAIEDKDVTVPSGTKLDGMANLIRQISGGSEKLNSTQAADAYDPTATYAIGDKVSYAGNVYSCISAISTPEAWDSTHWDQVDPIQDQVDEVRNTLTHLENGLAIIVDGDTCTTAVPVGGYAYIKNNTHGLAEGLYTNTSASVFPTSGGTANSSVFTAVSGGGLNTLTELGSVYDLTGLASNKATIDVAKAARIGKIMSVEIIVDATATLSELIVTGLPKSESNFGFLNGYNSGTSSPLSLAIIDTTGSLIIRGTINNGNSLRIGGTYITQD